MKLKVVLLTSNHIRHKFWANKIAKSLNVVGVVSEKKSFSPLNQANDSKEEKIISDHLALREVEENKFGTFEFSSGIDVFTCEPKSINNKETIDFINTCNPDYLLVFGTGIIKAVIIDLFPGKIINMHLGLSPYYRGSGTNFFPVFNSEPEFCGVTIHMLDAGIDSGDIIEQGRAKIVAKDNIHSLGNKIIDVGAQLMTNVIKRVEEGYSIPNIKQNLSIGKTYYRKDFNSKAVEVAYKNIEEGLFSKYESLQFEKLKSVKIYEAK